MAARAFPCNQTCSICRETDASYFCDCRDSLTIFCSHCSALHSDKLPLLPHRTIPIAALGKNIEEYLRKYENLKQAEDELRRNVDRMEQFSLELEDLLGKCISYLTDLRSWWKQYMHTEKEMLSAAIEAAIQETASCLENGRFPVDALAQAIWVLPAEEMKVVSCSITPPDLQARFKNCATYYSDLPNLCECFDQPHAEEVAVQLAKFCKKHMLSDDILTGWLEFLDCFTDTDPLKFLFQKLTNLPQFSVQVVVRVIDATLILCIRKPKEVANLSKGLSKLLDDQKLTPFLISLSTLSDTNLVAILLETVLQNLSQLVLTACITLSNLLSGFHKDEIQPNKFEQFLHHKTASLISVVQACSVLMKNPANCMGKLSARLIEALEGPIQVEVLIFVSTLAADLLRAVPPKRVEELGLLLLSDSAVLIVHKLHAFNVQMIDKLVLQLKSPEPITVEALELLCVQSSEETPSSREEQLLAQVAEKSQEVVHLQAELIESKQKWADYANDLRATMEELANDSEKAKMACAEMRAEMVAIKTQQPKKRSIFFGANNY